MRNAIVSFFMLFVTGFCLMQSAYADPSAAGIFSSFGGTTTIDKGGAAHSQARSIYSFGGGMTSFQGKRVNLMAVDPPSFSAGCSGISWHFGGFAFISVDEIRQLVESVAQASLGIAVDLAMNTLCPQCYAVMSKLREMANAMRNAAADSCSIAKHLGDLIQGQFPGLTSSSTRQKDCGQIESAKNGATSFMDGLMNPCKLVNQFEDKLDSYGKDISNFFSSGTTADKPTPAAEYTNQYGNRTYDALDALGYADGLVKDLLLSYLGMVIIPSEPASDCKATLSGLFGTSSASTTSTDPSAQPSAEEKAKLAAIKSVIDNSQETRTVAPATTNTSTDKGATPADAKTTDANTTGNTNGKKGKPVCYAPPLITSINEMGMKLLCGFNPYLDMATFSRKFSISQEALANSSVGSMCNTKFLTSVQGPLSVSDFPDTSTKNDSNPFVYTCRSAANNRCQNPDMIRMSEAINNVSALAVDVGPATSAKAATPSPGAYTGLAWMVLDALYSGVDAVRAGVPLSPATVKILNGSGYPLYRLLNVAAVYPGVADELLQAYGAMIATNYALDTMDKLMRPGSMPNIDLKAIKGGMPYQDVIQLRSDIATKMRDESSPVRSQIFARLAEKRALVDNILQVNKALQADVISQGLGGNAEIAVSLKQQLTVPSKK